jgi:hypothetical protein
MARPGAALTYQGMGVRMFSGWKCSLNLRQTFQDGTRHVANSNTVQEDSWFLRLQTHLR